MKKQLPADVRVEVEQWLNQIGGILHWWEADGTYFVVVRADDQLYFLRLFTIGGKLSLSQDHQCNT